MGMDLYSDSGAYFRSNGTTWEFTLEIARQYGWSEPGTLPPDNWDFKTQWEGQYNTNEGQRVSQLDASELGVALERYLADPRRLLVAQKVWDEFSKAMELYYKKHGMQYTPHELTDAHETHVREFIAFFQKGSFRIE